MRRTWFRLDTADPRDWDWDPFPTARYRFDSASGKHRVRYAAWSARGAMRERFDHVRRWVTAAELDLHLVELTGRVRVLDVRTEATLDALGFDDQVSTSRSPQVWDTCQMLTDRVVDWFGDRVDGLVYRSRTTPQRSANLAFFGSAALQARSLGRLRDQEDLLVACIASDGFTVQGL